MSDNKLIEAVYELIKQREQAAVQRFAEYVLLGEHGKTTPEEVDLFTMGFLKDELRDGKEPSSLSTADLDIADKFGRKE